MPKSQLDWLGVASLWIGAIIMALKAGNLPIISGAPAWLTANWWSYAPLVLVTLYILLALQRHFSTGAKHRIVDRPVSSDGVAQLRPTELSFTATAVSKSDILPDRVSKEYIDLLKSRPTQIGEQRFLRQYEGKWIKLNLKLATAEHRSGHLVMQFYHRDDHMEYGPVFVYFDQKWDSHFDGVKTGETVSFIAKILINGHRQFVDAEPA